MKLWATLINNWNCYSGTKSKLFSYDKLFWVKELTKTDKMHIEAGKESSVDRTQRLFYVTCTRAKESLAIVMYTSDSEKIRNQAISKGWFSWLYDCVCHNNRSCQSVSHWETRHWCIFCQWRAIFKFLILYWIHVKLIRFYRYNSIRKVLPYWSWFIFL